MERVRDAFRKQRHTPTAATAGNQYDGPNPQRRSRKAGTGLDITYTQTPTVALDETVLKQNRVVTSLQSDPRGEVYRQLRTQVLAHMKAHGQRTLAITSPHEGAGKTLTAINLAIAISREQNQTVLLIDLDLRHPSVHATLGLDVDCGIADCILDDTPVSDVLINPQFERLVIAPGRPLETYSSELLSSPRMQSILDDIINRYDQRLIIFDLPPLLRNDDALVFTPQVDATLLVLEDGADNADDVKRCLHLLKDCHLLGTILNKAR